MISNLLVQIPAWIMYLSTCFYSQGYAKKVCALCWQVIRSPLALAMGLEGTACSCPQRYGLLQQRSQSKISKGRRHMGPNSEETRPRLPESSPSAILQGVLNSSSNKLWQHMWNVCQGSLSETQRPKLLLGSCPVSTLYLAFSKIPESQKESRCSV